MAAEKTKRRKKKAANGKKVPARKVAMGRKRASGFGRHAAKELSLGPLERSGETVAAAARCRWLSAESLVTSQVASVRRSVPRARTKVAR